MARRRRDAAAAEASSPLDDERFLVRLATGLRIYAVLSAGARGSGLAERMRHAPTPAARVAIVEDWLAERGELQAGRQQALSLFRQSVEFSRRYGSGPEGWELAALAAWEDES